MASSNSTNLELNDIDNSFSVESVKPYVSSSKLKSSVSSSYSNIRVEKPSQSDTTLKLFKDIYKPPLNSSDKYSTKSQDTHSTSYNYRDTYHAKSKRYTHSENHTLGKKHVSRDLKVDKSDIGRSQRGGYRKVDKHVNNLTTGDSKTGFKKDGDGLPLASETQSTSLKRKFDLDNVKDVPQKKVHNENPLPVAQEEEESDVIDFIKILDDHEVPEHLIEIDSRSNSMDFRGDTSGKSNTIINNVSQSNNTNTLTTKNTNTIQQDSSLSEQNVNKSQMKNVEEKKREIEMIKKPESKVESQKNMIETKENKLSINVIETNKTSFDEANHGLDILDLDGLGIKILDEIFLCKECNIEIPQDVSSRGSKDMCGKCQQKESNIMQISEYNLIIQCVNKNRQKIVFSETFPESESEFFSNSHPFPGKYLVQDKFASIDEDLNLYFEAQIQSANTMLQDYDKENEWIDILESKHNIQKLIGVGQKYQAEIPHLNLYIKKEKRDIKRLWNPRRVDRAAFEKFRFDINGKNSVYLIDEEIAEILVRNDCDVEKALRWSTKTNPEFQAYVKRSTNRRRLITKMGPK